jgi:hypothetical protein
MNNYDLVIEGTLKEKTIDNKIRYIAASPANYMANYSGSGLPFVNSQQAFYNTPNKGEVILDEFNNYKINLYLPNSYMSHLGTIKINPTLLIQYYNLNNELKTEQIKVSYGIPYRTLTYPKQRKDNNFYISQFCNEVKDQWKILVDSSYPAQNINMPNNHWGLKPPY